MQEVLIEAVRTLEGFRLRGDTSFQHWIARLVENRLRSEARRVRRRPLSIVKEEQLLDAPGPSGLGEVEEADELERQRELVERGMEGLRERLQIVLRRRREGRDFQSIGRELGCSAEAARRLHRRATVELVERVHRLRRAERRR